MKGKKQNIRKRKPLPPSDAFEKSGLVKTRQKPFSTAQEPSFARLIIVVAILVVTFIAYFPSLQNGILKAWDDQDYVTNNELVKSLSSNNIVKIFKEDKGLYGNFHPLTILSLAVNYHFSQEDPYGYHLTNLLLHLLNTILVFIFIHILTKRNLVIAAITTLLFGLSPIHVESVAWISERKDVLYTFFFLSSLITYQQFLKRSDWKLYVASLLLFLCAMLSKAMAASLPLVLILLSFMEKRRWTWKLLTDKIPYFILAVFFGLYAIRLQGEGNAITELLPLFRRVFHVCYGFVGYILKTFLPTGLSAFYPYPYPMINTQWITKPTPPVFYLTVILAIAVFCFSIYCVTSNKKNLLFTGFGLLFFAFTIALVLQFIPVGRAIMADRYAYIPSIGLFFIAGYYASLLYEKKAYKIPVITLVIMYAGFFLILTREQIRVWKNDETLWNNVIRTYPLDPRIAIAYTNRAYFLISEGKPREALKDLLLAVDWNPKDDNSLEKIGKIYGKEMQDLETSIIYFNQAYQANPGNIDVIKDLATAYGIKGDYKSSLNFALNGLKINGNDAFLLYNTGLTYSNLGQQALGQEYINKAFKIDPGLKGKYK